MALIKCMDCGTEMSDSAQSCPRCGWIKPRDPAIVKLESEINGLKTQRAAIGSSAKYTAGVILGVLLLIGSVIFFLMTIAGTSLFRISGAAKGVPIFINILVIAISIVMIIINSKMRREIYSKVAYYDVLIREKEHKLDMLS